MNKRQVQRESVLAMRRGIITIDHTDDGVVSFGPKDRTLNDHRYALGDMPPNYPVPAIVLSVEFTQWHDNVSSISELSIWNVSNIDVPKLVEVWHR